MPMTKKQAKALVKGVKDPELLAAWKARLGGGPATEDVPAEAEDVETGERLAASLRADGEAW